LPFNALLLPAVPVLCFAFLLVLFDEVQKDEFQTDLPVCLLNFLNAVRTVAINRQRLTVAINRPLPREERPSNYIDSWRALYSTAGAGVNLSTVGLAYSLWVAGPFLLSFPAWCVGGTVLFMMNKPFSEQMAGLVL
jgi:hypothetical protein